MKIYEAIENVSAFIGNLKKSEKNPFFKSKYVPLDAILDEIKPILHTNGLHLLSYADLQDGLPVLKSKLIHSSGESLDLGSYPLNPIKNDPQGIGASITYARRYQIQAIFNFTGEEDDDGNTASGLTVKKETNKKPEPKTEPKKEDTVKAERVALFNFLKKEVGIEKVVTEEDKTNMANYCITLMGGKKSVTELSEDEVKTFYKKYISDKELS